MVPAFPMYKFVWRVCHTAICLFLFLSVNAHNVHHHHHNEEQLPVWTNADHSSFSGSFLMVKDNIVHFETSTGTILKIPFNGLSKTSQDVVKSKMQRIAKLNRRMHPTAEAPKTNRPGISYYTVFIYAFFLCLVGSLVFLFTGKKIKTALAYFLFVTAGTAFIGFQKAPLFKTRSSSNPSVIDSAFIPFKPAVSTFWDTAYFYVESYGIPETHSMMTGITSWQQQVPIAQCYFGSNAWPIPLNPVLAATPTPVDASHFTKGAIAIAVNGVPIFNPYTNTGVDAYLDGQLDNWGGHSGRADDYHYHVAPLHLYGTTTFNLPIAYAFDGFAVYGSLEPDGSAMTGLDANHGHFGTDGVYHYHGTSTAPYMIGNMRGTVTEDVDHQIVPQAVATPVRPPQSPLSGAVITGFATGTNNYTLTYTLAGQTHQVIYSWTSSGVYNFSFVGPSSTTDSTYNGFVPCNVPFSIFENVHESNLVKVYPNPASDHVHVKAVKGQFPFEIEKVELYNANGQCVYTSKQLQGEINLQNVPAGKYNLVLWGKNKFLSKKLVIN